MSWFWSDSSSLQLKQTAEREWFDLAYLAAIAGSSAVKESKLEEVIPKIEAVCRKISRSGGRGAAVKDEEEDKEEKRIFQRWSEDLDHFDHPLAKMHSNLLERMEFLMEYLQDPSDNHKQHRQKFLGLLGVFPSIHPSIIRFPKHL